MNLLRFWVSILVFGTAIQAKAQTSSFLPDELYNTLTNEISGDIAYDNLRHLVMYDAPNGLSRAFADEAQWIVKRSTTFGVANTHFVPLKSWASAGKLSVDFRPVHLTWNLKGGELWIVKPQLIKLADARESPIFVAEFSPTADITAELIDVGMGNDKRDYIGKDLDGKIVLAYGPLDEVRQLACDERHAVAIISYGGSMYTSGEGFWTDQADSVHWSVLHTQSNERAVPAFKVSPRVGITLSRWLAGHPPTQIFAKPVIPTPLVIHLKIDADQPDPGDQGLVEAIIPGTTYHDQAIVLSAHMQEIKTSANDNRSGSANLLEIARALQAMITDGRLARPKRDIRLWWTNEYESEYEYFAENPNLRQTIIANINQDMVGAMQSLGSRIQHVSRLPYARWSFLNDVVEDIVNSLREGNNAYLSAFQNGAVAPFSRPIFAHLGTREPYRVDVVPYFDSTDHHVFNEMGIPGVTFTNWPDRYIGTTADDIAQIDPTQLQRNAVAVTAIALYLANLTDPEIPALAAHVYGTARQRMARDFETALQRMINAPITDLESAYKDGVMLVETAHTREVAGFDSLGRIIEDDKNRKIVANWVADLNGVSATDKGRLETWYGSLGGKRSPPPLSTAEKSLSSEVPRNIGTLEEYSRLRQTIETPKALHPLMKWEALNYVDGKRSLLDIYRLVRGESLSAGEWYYGVVTPEQIDQLFVSASRNNVVKIFAAAN